MQAVFFVQRDVRALGFSWSASPVSVFSSEVSSYQSDDCETSRVPTQIVGDSYTWNMCILEGDNVRYGTYPSSVSFGYDTKMYKLNIGCSQSKCLYIPQTDTMIISSQIGWSWSKSLTIYKNFKNRVTKTVNPLLVTEYNFDASNPDYRFVDTAGNYIGTGGFGASSNGKWLGFELYQKGFAVMNLETYGVRRVSDLSFGYGYGMNPDAQFAVSNDANAIAVSGSNVGLYLIDTSNQCGDTPINELVVYNEVLSSSKACPRAIIETGRFMNGFQSAEEVGFSSDGGELSFDAYSYTGEHRYVVFHAPGYNPPQLEYLGMGDSFSSGEGDLGRKQNGGRYYLDYTDVIENSKLDIPEEKCHISTRSYPYLLAEKMNLSASEWGSVTCSGAVIDDINGSNDKYLGQGERLKNYQIDNLKRMSLNDMIPGRNKQIEFVEKYKPKVITLTAGGNDVGFGEIIKACLRQLETCSQASGDGKILLGKDLKNQIPRLKRLYQDLYTASNQHSKIYVLGYPQFINADDDAECELNVGTLKNDYAERQMIYESVKYINKIIKYAAESAGVKYIDIENSLDGHRLCDSGQKYVNGVVGVAGWGGNEEKESFHPNSEAHKLFASRISEELGWFSPLDYDYCSGTAKACPNKNVPMPDTPNYFLPPSDWKVELSEYTKISDDISVKDAPMNIKIQDNSLQPGSVTYVTAFSDPTPLGELIVNQKGGINSTISIPDSLPVGYHTLRINGLTFSGEPISLQQVFELQSADPNDVDEDGIDDSVDQCLYIPPANVDYDGDGTDDACDPVIGDKKIIPVEAIENNNVVGLSQNNSVNNSTSINDSDGTQQVIDRNSDGTATSEFTPSAVLGLADTVAKISQTVGDGLKTTVITVIIILVLLIATITYSIYRYKIRKNL